MHLVFGGRQHLEVKDDDEERLLLVFLPGGELDATWRVRRNVESPNLVPQVASSVYRAYDLHPSAFAPDTFSVESPVFDRQDWSFYVNYVYSVEDPDITGPVFLDGTARVVLQKYKDGEFEVTIHINNVRFCLHPKLAPIAPGRTRFERVLDA